MVDSYQGGIDGVFSCLGAEVEHEVSKEYLIFEAMMLMDAYLPQYDAVERHATVVCASAARVCAALRTADPAASPLVRLLLALRTLPAVLRDGGSGVRHLRRRLATPTTLRAFEEQGFVILAETPPQTRHRASHALRALCCQPGKNLVGLHPYGWLVSDCCATRCLPEPRGPSGASPVARQRRVDE